jgi:hypothetical protein
MAPTKDAQKLRRAAERKAVFIFLRRKKVVEERKELPFLETKKVVEEGRSANHRTNKPPLKRRPTYFKLTLCAHTTTASLGSCLATRAPPKPPAFGRSAQRP